MMFAARQIQEKCKEQNMDLYILFVDLTKASDSVPPRNVENTSPYWNPTQDEDDLQRLADSLSAAAKHFGLTINIKKTEVMFQPSKGSTANSPEIKIDGKVLNNIDSFTYLGSSLSFSNSLDKEISNRIAKASASYGRLHKQDF
ncbi:hypothetical protein ACOMHN_059932 [Nucella lapillus]